jgi:uncharacterized protein
MAGNKAGGAKTRETNKLRHGENFYSNIGTLGGSKKVKKSFACNPKLASMAGKIGGAVSAKTRWYIDVESN